MHPHNTHNFYFWYSFYSSTSCLKTQAMGGWLGSNSMPITLNELLHHKPDEVISGDGDAKAEMVGNRRC